MAPPPQDQRPASSVSFAFPSLTTRSRLARVLEAVPSNRFYHRPAFLIGACTLEKSVGMAQSFFRKRLHATAKRSRVPV